MDIYMLQTRYKPWVFYAFHEAVRLLIITVYKPVVVVYQTEYCRRIVSIKRSAWPFLIVVGAPPRYST